MCAYVQVNKTTEVAMTSNYNLQSGNVLIAVGGKYTVEDGAVLKVLWFIAYMCRIKVTIL